MNTKHKKTVSKIFDLIISDIFWVDNSNQIKTLKDAMMTTKCSDDNGINFTNLDKADLFGAYNAMKIKAQDFINLKSPDASKEILSKELKNMIFQEVNNILSKLQTNTDSLEQIA